MSNRFHNKWHRNNHHTYKDSTIIDSGWDPIASQEAPFRGDFVLSHDGASSTDGREWTVSAYQMNAKELHPWTSGGDETDDDQIVVKGSLGIETYDGETSATEGMYISGGKFYCDDHGYEFPSAGSAVGSGDIRTLVVEDMIFDDATAANPKIKSDLLPSYVDDVLEFSSVSAFPQPGERGIIYVATDTGDIYRWSGTQYIEIASEETSAFATKVSNATSGNFAALSSDGNIMDSGWKPSDFAITEDATLVPIYTFTEWELTPEVPDATAFWNGANWEVKDPYGGGYPADPHADYNATTFFTYVDGVGDVTATRIQTDFIGYRLGPATGVNADKPLAPSGDYALHSEVTAPVIETTWSELKAMRDASSGAGSLVPGQQYRITDYKATTVQADTQSANHPFDLIVVADAPNKLNERARAALHSGDTYFSTAGCKLEAWQVWYCLDNDTNKFMWADSTNGKGVIHRLIDEWGNDCPYDFKGITMKAYGDTDNVFRYTFDSGASSGNTDYSLDGGKSNRTVHNNKIGVYWNSGKLEINQIVFKGGGCTYNTFWNSCSFNTFGNYCSSNTFGNGCSSNTFGNSCSFNTFRNSFSYNILGDYCFFNTFGNSCSSNTFGYGCSSNTFGNSCSSNTFGNYCSSNTFGYGCSSNTFGDYVIHEFDPYSRYSIGKCVFVGGILYKLTNSYMAEFDLSLSYVVGDVVYYDGEYWKCTTDHSGDWNSDDFSEIGYELTDFMTRASGGDAAKSYYCYVVFEGGNSNIVLNCTSTLSFSNKYQNVLIALGVNDGSSDKTINDSNVNQTFKTTYQPANSQVISV